MHSVDIAGTDPPGALIPKNSEREINGVKWFKNDGDMMNRQECYGIKVNAFILTSSTAVYG